MDGTHNHGKPFGSPGARYHSIIRQGYETAGFDVNKLDRIVDDAEFSMGIGIERGWRKPLNPYLNPYLKHN